VSIYFCELVSLVSLSLELIAHTVTNIYSLYGVSYLFISCAEN